MTEKKLLFLALNEFNIDLLKKVVDAYNLPNLKKILDLNAYQTQANDTYESNFLEPWSQWVSVHTGQPTGVHKIQHLGDVPSLDFPQIWEVLSKNGIKSGIWGAMNAQKGSAEQCQFFLPDPWTFSEQSDHVELTKMLGFARFMAKNRLHIFQAELLKHFFNFLRPILKRPRILAKILWRLPKVCFYTLIYRSPFMPFAFTEYALALLFNDYRRKFSPQFSFIFVNTIAHLQHYYWDGRSLDENGQFRLGFAMVDEVVGEVLSSLRPNEEILVANAFSQKNSFSEEVHIGYRPIDGSRFLKAAGFNNVRIEELMTHDAHLFFANESDALHAFEALKKSTVDGHQLYFVQKDTHNPKKLFFRTEFTGVVDDKSEIKINGKILPFRQYYRPLGTRTGKHRQHGDVFTTLSWSTKNLNNFELFHRILDFYSITNEQSGKKAIGSR